MNNTKEYLLTAVINTTTAGDNIMIVAPTVTGNYLAIDFISFKVEGDTAITFKSGTTALSGPIALASYESLTWENAIKNSNGIITCKKNEAFIINLSAGVQVSGMIRYREVGF